MMMTMTVMVTLTVVMVTVMVVTIPIQTVISMKSVHAGHFHEVAASCNYGPNSEILYVTPPSRRIQSKCELTEIVCP